MEMRNRIQWRMENVIGAEKRCKKAARLSRSRKAPCLMKKSAPPPQRLFAIGMKQRSTVPP